MYNITVAVHQNLGYGLAEFSGSRCLRRVLSGCSHLSSPKPGDLSSLMTQWVKNLPAVRRHGFDPWLGKTPWRGNGNILQYSCPKIPWTDEPGGLQPTGLQVRHDWATKHTPADLLVSSCTILLADSIPWGQLEWGLSSWLAVIPGTTLTSLLHGWVHKEAYNSLGSWLPSMSMRVQEEG